MSERPRLNKVSVKALPIPGEPGPLFLRRCIAGADGPAGFWRAGDSRRRQELRHQLPGRRPRAAVHNRALS